MVKKIIIVQHYFGLKTAKTQRVIAEAKIFKRQGLNVLFIISGETDEDLEYLPKDFDFLTIKENKVNKLKCYCNFYKAIKRSYDNDSAILFYGAPYYSFLFRSPNFRVFAEITEFPFCGHKMSLLDRFLSSLSEFGVKHFNTLFVISQSLKDYYSRIGVQNICVINMFVDVSRFDGLTRNPTEKYIGYCGTISIFKDGVDNLISAFSLFAKSHPEYKLYLFGDFENNNVKDTLVKLVSALGVSDRVVFTGFVDSEEMPQKLLDAEILALARPDNKQSQYGFPTKLGEYLATGNPIVITSVGEIPLFLKDGNNAFLVKPNDYKDFSDKLDWVATHLEQARAIALKGKDLTKSEFSSDVQTKKMIEEICFK